MNDMDRAKVTFMALVRSMMSAMTRLHDELLKADIRDLGLFRSVVVHINIVGRRCPLAVSGWVLLTPMALFLQSGLHLFPTSAYIFLQSGLGLFTMSGYCLLHIKFELLLVDGELVTDEPIRLPRNAAMVTPGRYMLPPSILLPR